MKKNTLLTASAFLFWLAVGIYCIVELLKLHVL